MIVDTANLALVFLPALLYAIAGLLDARKKGEDINWPLFVKTLVIGAVGAGLMSQSTGDIVVAFTGTTAFTLIVDSLTNAIFRKPPATT